VALVENHPGNADASPVGIKIPYNCGHESRREDEGFLLAYCRHRQLHFLCRHNKGIRMFNRRTFLKTTATALPIAGALDILEPGFALSADTVATAAVSGDTPNLIPLPQRLAPVELSQPALAAEDSPRRAEQHD
jgi:hypothetical protein